MTLLLFGFADSGRKFNKYLPDLRLAAYFCVMMNDDTGSRHGNARPRTNRNAPDNGNSGMRKRRRRISRPDGEVKKITQQRPVKKEPVDLRLNKYISNSGICSRRQADKLIEDGVVKVNGEVVTTLGHRVKLDDVVEVKNKKISPSKKAYIILNKPKNYITTTNDPEGRKTVMELVEDVDSDRVYPVGRLDRNTTGILIFTNDGELAQKLMHPSTNIPKVYSVELNKPLDQRHYFKLQKGIKLFDGWMKPDKIAYVDSEDHRKIGVQIHSGRNRVVRRIFEALGYEVEKLDRVVYADIDKQGLARGKWRNLTEKEVSNLKRAARLR